MECSSSSQGFLYLEKLSRGGVKSRMLMTLGGGGMYSEVYFANLMLGGSGP